MPNYLTGDCGTVTGTETWVRISGEAGWDSVNEERGFTVKRINGQILPQTYFKYVKNKLGLLEKARINSRLKKLEKAFLTAVENGQEALGEKLLKSLAQATQESFLFAKGIRYFIEAKDLRKFKNKIKGGHISDTTFEDYTRIIPKKVLKKKKKFDRYFDEFIIYHYWDEKAADVKDMSPEVKSKMKDPILFGKIRESDRFYFVADWVDEQCDLTFDQIVDFLGGEDEDFELKKNIKVGKERV